MFRPESRKEIRHLALALEWDYLQLRLPAQDSWYLGTWAELLSGLFTLQLVVGYHAVYTFPLNEWHELLKPQLEFINQHIPPQMKVVVDTDGDESVDQLVDEIISNHCTFEQLAAGDDVFGRGVFANLGDATDLDTDSSEDDEFIDQDDPYYSLYL